MWTFSGDNLYAKICSVLLKDLSFLITVVMTDIQSTSPFKRTVVKDTQLFTADTRPQVIQEKLDRCEGPPALNKLNPFR